MYMMMNRKEAGTVDRESGELNLKKKKTKKKIVLFFCSAPTFVLNRSIANGIDEI